MCRRLAVAEFEPISGRKMKSVLALALSGTGSDLYPENYREQVRVNVPLSMIPFACTGRKPG